jgi:hypothetical protein
MKIPLENFFIKIKNTHLGIILATITPPLFPSRGVYPLRGKRMLFCPGTNKDKNRPWFPIGKLI